VKTKTEKSDQGVFEGILQETIYLFLDWRRRVFHRKIELSTENSDLSTTGVEHTEGRVFFADNPLLPKVSLLPTAQERARKGSL